MGEGPLWGEGPTREAGLPEAPKRHPHSRGTQGSAQEPTRVPKSAQECPRVPKSAHERTKTPKSAQERPLAQGTWRRELGGRKPFPQKYLTRDRRVGGFGARGIQRLAEATRSRQCPPEAAGGRWKPAEAAMGGKPPPEAARSPHRPPPRQPEPAGAAQE